MEMAFVESTALPGRGTALRHGSRYDRAQTHRRPNPWVEREPRTPRRRAHGRIARERAPPPHVADQLARHGLPLPERPRLDHGVCERRLPRTGWPCARGVHRRAGHLRQPHPPGGTGGCLEKCPDRHPVESTFPTRIPPPPCGWFLAVGAGPWPRRLG